MTKRYRFIRFTSGPALPVPGEVAGSAVEAIGDDDPAHEIGGLRTCGNCGKLILLRNWWTPVGVCPQFCCLTHGVQSNLAIGVSLAEIAENRWPVTGKRSDDRIQSRE